MKNLALIIVSMSVISSFAVVALDDTVVSNIPWRNKIDAALLDKMEKTSLNEEITVCIWYDDIDQDEVNQLTTKTTGLTPESCSIIKELPSQSLITSLQNGDKKAEKQMNDYLSITQEVRTSERLRTRTYVNERRNISVDKYTKKSKQIINQLSLIENNVIFCSEFAPMIVTKLTKNGIENAAKHNIISKIDLYVDFDILDPNEVLNSDDSDDSKYAKYSMKLEEVYEVYGLSGNGVNVGLLEKNVPGLYTNSEFVLGYDLSDITIVQSQDYTVSPGVYEDSNLHDHANNTARIMMHNEYGIAPNINLYATQASLSIGFINLEEMLKFDNENTIDVIEANIALRSEYFNEYEYAYNVWDKYFDHLVAYHNVTIVVAGGNNVSSWGERVNSPGMGYNAITVSGYNNNNNYNDDDDYRMNYSWKNSYVNELDNIEYFGCEKPDVIMPVNFRVAGTSVASPALTAQIALMLELKPSLSLQPQAVKAIVLASCHRKVNSAQAGEEQESMQQGITERQGAGAPDAWAMISIVCQGTYGVGELSGNSHTVNIVQPPYGADNMNVSMAWLKENGHLDNDEDVNVDYTDPDNITIEPEHDLNLQVLRSDGAVTASSSLEHSSTEMCYLSLSNTQFKYQININRNSLSMAKVRYAYAWSTNEMKETPISTEGIYYLKNSANGRYVTYNTSSTTPQAVMRSVTSQLAFSNAHMWILQQDENAVNLSSGYGASKLYLGYDDTASGTNVTSQLVNVAFPMNIEYNEDGTVSVYNTDKSRILTYSGSSVVWKTINSATSTVLSNQKWYFEKVNYLSSDANMDGAIGENSVGEYLDALTIQRYLVGLETFSSVQCYLADVDGDGDVTIVDAQKITLLYNN